jgi:hypothetical protein
VQSRAAAVARECRRRNAKQQLPDAPVILTEKQAIGASHAERCAHGVCCDEATRGMDFAEAPKPS